MTRRPEGTTRVTIDVPTELRQQVKVWEAENGMKLAELTRHLYRQLLEHPPTQAAVRRRRDLDG